MVDYLYMQAAKMPLLKTGRRFAFLSEKYGYSIKTQKTPHGCAGSCGSVCGRFVAPGQGRQQRRAHYRIGCIGKCPHSYGAEVNNIRNRQSQAHLEQGQRRIGVSGFHAEKRRLY